MGYTTNFDGTFKLSPGLNEDQIETINEFSETRHGTNMDVYPGFPGFWCDWITNGDELYHNGDEKFYYYTEWLEYLIENFFKHWGITVNGKVNWYGEDPTDIGVIEVVDNVVSAYKAEITKGKKVYS